MSLIDRLLQLGLLDTLKFHICSVGARELSEGDFDRQWFSLGRQLTIYGFEPDAQECERLTQKHQASQQAHQAIYLPKALSARKESRVLYRTQWDACSSLYPPNRHLCHRFSLAASNEKNIAFRLTPLSQVTEVKEKVNVECTTLDEELRDIDLDFLKIDVQGAELDILRGASEKLLKNLLAIQLEVEFTSIYQDQPLFVDIDQFLRGQGFSLLSINPSYRPRVMAPIGLRKYGSRTGQILWGEAIYYRDLLADHESTSLLFPDLLLKQICVLGCLDSMRYIDICAELIVHLITHFGDPKCNRYFELESLIRDLFQDPDYGLNLSESDLEQTLAIRTIHSARELADQLYQQELPE
jgi:FkbM family methyltransferase